MRIPFFKETEDWMDRAERFLVKLVARVGPWCSPLPTAFIVFDRTVALLGWPWWVGLVAGLVLESLGLVASFVALDLYGWNRKKRKSDPSAPLWLAVAVLGVYLVVAELLTVLLDIATKPLTVVTAAPGAFPFLTLAGVALIALRVDQAEREEEVGKARQAEKDERDRKREEKAAPAKASVALAEKDRERALLLREKIGPGVAFGRKEAESALGLAGTVTSILLSRMVDGGELKVSGRNRSTRYEFGKNGHKEG